MDLKELRVLRADQTEEALLKKIDRILDETEDSGRLDHDDICAIKDAWEAILKARQCAKEP